MAAAAAILVVAVLVVVAILGVVEAILVVAVLAAAILAGAILLAAILAADTLEASMATAVSFFLAPLVWVILGVMAIHMAMAMIIIPTMPTIIPLAMMVTLMGAPRQAPIMDQARAW